MQCIYKNFIYAIDKKAVLNEIQWLNQKKIINLRKIINTGNGSLRRGLEMFTSGKEWVYFNRTPEGSKHRLHRALYQLGFFKKYEIPCGKCEICRVEKSKDWTTKGWCESQMWKHSTFITLTYNNENLPEKRMLRRADIQKFWKDLRYHLYKNTKKASEIDLTLERSRMEEIYTDWIEDTFGRNKRRKNRYPIRYLNCGEYGPMTKRPHYHAVIWNFEPMDMRRFSKDRRGYWLYTSEKLNRIWGKGYVIVGNATPETVGYVARYCTKKFSRTEEEHEKMKKKKQIEFIGASSLGYLGYFYWVKFKDMIKRNMGVLMKMKEHTFLAKLPKAMQKSWKEEDEDGFEEYDYWKCKIGKENWEYILSKTDLSESEYIKESYRARLKKYKLLKREKGDLQGL